jgi:hypothetical protein
MSSSAELYISAAGDGGSYNIGVFAGSELQIFVSCINTASPRIQ